MNAMVLDKLRHEMNNKLNTSNKVKFGQFMTPSVIADYMAGLFSQREDTCTLLDCGAGIGSLAISAVNKLNNVKLVELWEIDPLMSSQLKCNMDKMKANYVLYEKDFILDSVEKIIADKGKRYTHAIINPPYKKINSNSLYRKQLSKVGVETVNLYTAFLALAIMLMKEQGEIVAIIPRSFCNGLYYKPFRKFLLDKCSIEKIHVFESRNKAFQDDDVLQENIIIKLRKNGIQEDVEISHSADHQFLDYQSKTVAFSNIVNSLDEELFIRIPKENIKSENKKVFDIPLTELGLNISTGAVVDFRIKDYLRQEPEYGTAPLLYPHHFNKGRLSYPQKHKKPNAVKIAPESQKWLMPNDGFYVLVKRFSAKEEKRRVVAYIVDPKEINQDWIGFENHWNVFHVNKHGLDKLTAMGLACFLNSTELDEHFRVFSGHTQVNATDLRNIKYPTRENLKKLGESYQITMDQEQIDNLIRKIQ